jgi:sulfite exporter TauE/SafE
LFAVVFSAAGILFSEKITPRISGVLMIVAASLMLISSVVKTFPKFSLCSLVSSKNIEGRVPFVIGFILGLNLCPPFIVGLIKILELRDIFLSSVFFITLFIGTSLYLIPIAFAASAFKTEFVMRLGLYLSFLVGIWFLVQGVMLIL